jgi:hypothetical protein
MESQYSETVQNISQVASLLDPKENHHKDANDCSHLQDSEYQLSNPRKQLHPQTLLMMEEKPNPS